MTQTLYEAVGGLPTLQKAHKIFYDKIYAHNWLGQFFAGHNQQAIEDRQTSFMAEKMGSTDRYLGKDLKMVHEAMYITREL
ncbi:MAG: group 1 truncated hemoglobin, partial [Gallionella sp.]